MNWQIGGQEVRIDAWRGSPDFHKASMRQDQIPSLTGLRFCAAAAVVVSHAVPKILVYDEQPMVLYLVSQMSAAGMTLFFVLSGFVIFLNYSRAPYSVN